MHALDDVFHAEGRLIDDLLQRVVDAVTYRRQIDRQQRQLLADVVVKLACNPRALGFLGLQQTPSEIANSPGRGPGELGLTPAQFAFASLRAYALNQQSRDHHRLRQQNHDEDEERDGLHIGHSTPSSRRSALPPAIVRAFQKQRRLERTASSREKTYA